MIDTWEKKKREREKELILRGMSETGKFWSRVGWWKRQEGFHPLGFKKANEWFNEGKLFFDDSEENNKRKAHCKVCGKELIKEEGHRIIIYANNWYNVSFYFGCEECKKQLDIFQRVG